MTDLQIAIIGLACLVALVAYVAFCARVRA